MSDVVPPSVADRFVVICNYVGGRASGASLFIEDGSFGSGIGLGPWTIPATSGHDPQGQATIVRDDQSGYTTGDDVTIKGPMIDLAIYENYHMAGMPNEFLDIFFGRESSLPTCPAPMSMLFQHELGHVTIHPAGEMDKYKAQAQSMPLPQTRGFTMQTMNILSDLVLNHSVMHSANVQGTYDPDILLRMRKEALFGLAGLYMMPQCQNFDAHAQMVDAGTLPDTRYKPNEPCTAESDDATGNVPCPFKTAGAVHDIGCYDNHYLDPNNPDEAANFMFASKDTPFWEALMGHGRGSQFYPMLSQSVRYNISGSNQVIFPISPALSERMTDSGGSANSMTCYNCTKCDNIWYRHDTAYSDLSMGSFITADGENVDPDFLQLLENYRDGFRCPGRVPYDSAYSCDATVEDIVMFSIDASVAPGSSMAPSSSRKVYEVIETKTFDNRLSSQTALFGMEPIWAVGFDATVGTIQIVRQSTSSPVNTVFVDRSYFIQICPDCGSPTINYYGEGQHHSGQGYLTETLERLPYEADQKTTLSQLLFMQQWAGIYADMANLVNDPQLRLLNNNGNRYARGWKSAKAFLELAGISRARMNRGC